MTISERVGVRVREFITIISHIELTNLIIIKRVFVLTFLTWDFFFVFHLFWLLLVSHLSHSFTLCVARAIMFFTLKNFKSDHVDLGITTKPVPRPSYDATLPPRRLIVTHTRLARLLLHRMMQNKRSEW